MLGRTAAFAGVGVVLLGAWAATNLWRYDDLAVARGGQASLPFFRSFIVDHIVRPENGPASRELAAAVERDLLTKEPYRSYGIDLETFFSRGSPREHEDLISLSDRLWGWDSDYGILGRAAREAVRAHPGTFARGVLGDFVEGALEAALRRTEGRPSVDADGAAPAPAPAPTVVVDGRSCPRRPRASRSRRSTRARRSRPPTGASARCGRRRPSTTSCSTIRRGARGGSANDRRVAELYAAFPDHWWSPWLGLQMDRSSKLYPPLWLWLLAGVVGVAVRRPRRWWATVAPVAGALVMLLATVMAVWAEPAYAVPVAPAFILFAAVGLLGDRATGPSGAASTRARRAAARCGASR